MKKKLLIAIPAGLVALLVIAFGVYFLVDGYGHLITMVASVDRVDMMQEGWYTHEDGTVLPYRIYVPESDEPLPLVLHLHGGGGRGDCNRGHAGRNSIMQTLLSEQNRQDFPAIVLAPQCPPYPYRWAGEQNVMQAVMGLLEDIIETHDVDAARVYIAGYSLGGQGTWAMLAEFPDFFAAAVPVCGWYDPERAPLIAHIPIWVFHGAHDRIVDVQGSRDMVAALEAAGSTSVIYTEYRTEGHSSWQRAWREPELFPWMFAQVRAEII